MEISKRDYIWSNLVNCHLHFTNVAILVYMGITVTEIMLISPQKMERSNVELERSFCCLFFFILTEYVQILGLKTTNKRFLKSAFLIGKVVPALK